MNVLSLVHSLPNPILEHRIFSMKGAYLHVQSHLHHPSHCPWAIWLDYDPWTCPWRPDALPLIPSPQIYSCLAGNHLSASSTPEIFFVTLLYFLCFRFFWTVRTSERYYSNHNPLYHSPPYPCQSSYSWPLPGALASKILHICFLNHMRVCACTRTHTLHSLF